MTNKEIIFQERCRLQREGKLGTTGQIFTFTDDSGKTISFPEPEEMHTYNAWKALGFQVRKGEKAITKLTIWKYTTTRKTETEEEAQERGHCFMKNSWFFSQAQVEKC